MKVLVINLGVNKTTEIDLPVRPNIGDVLPINYINEKVTQVVHATPLLMAQHDTKGCDLWVYTE